MLPLVALLLELGPLAVERLHLLADVLHDLLGFQLRSHVRGISVCVTKNMFVATLRKILLNV